MITIRERGPIMTAARTALVTGGASGIGAATVRRFLKDGLNVVAVDSNRSALEGKAREINSNQLKIIAGDICDSQVREDAISIAMREFGALNIIVNNAAVFLLSGVDASVEQWQKTFEVNLLAGAQLVVQALPQLKISNSPSIVNVTSISAHRAQTGRWTYNSMKGALLELTKCQALDLAPYGIRVNSVSPGWIWTETSDQAANGDRAKWEPIWGKYSMMDRCGEPAEVASAIAWLASPDASYVTGADLAVDGGYLALSPEGSDTLNLQRG